jgi:acetyl esterase/lipase
MFLKDISYGSDENQKLDISIPQKRMTHAIVYIHGGAFMSGSKLKYPSFLEDYSERNIIASINYRVIQNDNTIHMGDILSDVNDAINKIIRLAKKYNVYVIKDFILIGHSAGGHISLLYGYKNIQENIKIATCISLAGPTDFTDDIGWSSMSAWGDTFEERLLFISNLGSRLTNHRIELYQMDWTKQENYPEFMEHIKNISPIMYVSKERKIPPTLMVHALNDDQVPYSNAVRLKAALDRVSVPNKLLTPTGKGNSHMLGGECYSDNSPVIFRNQTWVEETKNWLKAYL